MYIHISKRAAKRTFAPAKSLPNCLPNFVDIGLFNIECMVRVTQAQTVI